MGKCLYVLRMVVFCFPELMILHTYIAFASVLQIVEAEMVAKIIKLDIWHCDLKTRDHFGNNVVLVVCWA